MEIEMNFLPVWSAEEQVQQKLNEKMDISTVINFDDCIIENVCVRFPHLLEQINELLDNKSLIKCKEVSRTMCSIIENQKSGSFLTKRVIQSYIKNSNEFAGEWKIVLKKLPVDKLNVFGILVEYFYEAVPSRYEFQWSPMHIAAERGDMNFCKLIAKLGTIKSYKWPPLYLSAQAGHLEVSKFLYEKFENKQNGDCFAQHLAAKNGHLEIYKFLYEKSNVINPIMQKAITPLHLAAQYGHFNLCKFICDNTLFVYPLRSDWITPLILAIHRGHIKIARLLHEKDQTKRWLRIAMIIFFFYMTFSIIYNILVGMLSSPFSPILIVMICFYTLVLIGIFWNILDDIRFISPKLDF
jgi:ankyrin repeat protein